MVNVLERNSQDSSGAAGAFIAFLMLAAGIVGITTRNSKGGGIAATILYLFGAIVGFTSLGTFKDLVIWSVLSTAFGLMFLFGSIFMKKAQENVQPATNPPQGYVPQGYAPHNYVPQSNAPQGYAPQGYAPQGYAQQGYAQQNYVPQGNSPQGCAQQGYAPQGYEPQWDAPQGDAPQGYASQGDAPQGDTPQGDAPQGDVQQNTPPRT